MTIFYSEVEPHSKCSLVMLHLSLATRIINGNPDNYYLNKSELLTRFWTDFTHQFGISVIEVQKSLL